MGPQIIFFILLVVGTQRAQSVLRRRATPLGPHDCMLEARVDREVSLYANLEQAEDSVPPECQGFDPGRKGIDFISVTNKRSHDNPGLAAVWVSGYPRSGSSTTLSMLSVGGVDSEDPGKTFSIFEPCHTGDSVSESLRAAGCGGLLNQIATCDFTGIENLWGWPDPHTTNNHTKYSPNSAKALCENAEMVAFKTVDYGHDISKWAWLLDQHPHLHVVDVVRDPRGIYASWKTLEPFASLVKSNQFYKISEMCDTFAANLKVNHPRVKHIVFEDLIKHPKETVWDVYLFLGMSYGPAQERWIERTFNAKWCPEPKPWEVGYTDCHVAGRDASTATKWESVLSAEELEEFNSNENCRRVVEAYGFESI